MTASLALLLLLSHTIPAQESPLASPLRVNSALDLPEIPHPAQAEPPASPPTPPNALPAWLPTGEAIARSATTVLLFAAASLIPVALLVLTAFTRISVVLLLTRQALGSPQVPGNQVLTALALLLTALVMAPTGQRVYETAIEPFAAGRTDAATAWTTATTPIKTFMIDQIVKSKHQHYLWALYDHALPPSPGRPEPTTAQDVPFRVVAPAFLISELTTALLMGFAIYLPFLVIDLVTSAVLSAMGLFLLPPALVALPLKLALFVLADGWMLVADTLLRSFETSG
jgi:flagellar biosynthetic protein FliP